MQGVTLAGSTLLALSLCAAPAAGGPGKDPLLHDFATATAHYLDLRHAVERSTPRPGLSADPEEILASTRRFADAIRAARTSAAPGDLLSLELGMLLRMRIGRVLKQSNITTSDLLDAIGTSGDDGNNISIDEEFPWQWGADMPPMLLVALPSIPEPLQFRLVGTSLVLVDAEANLILDILPDALPLIAPATFEI